jgi:3-methylfumaryl-CoA hydratase
MSPTSSEELHGWIGRTESHTDLITAWPVAALNAALDYDAPKPAEGDAIPPAWHWLYFLEAKRAGELGPDGHPRRGGFLPPVTLPRRMWAGGRIEFHSPLRIGDRARRDSTILNVEHKQGRTGELVFVTVRHEVKVGEKITIREEYDIVYRGAPQPGDKAPPGKTAAAGAAWQRALAGNPVLLFRYSALTFNGHRIHYDLDYVREEEHYPGLIVHGPLQATLLLELCRQRSPKPVRKLEYRALHPIFHTERFTVNGNPSADGSTAELWTANADGHVAMTGTAHF